MVKPYQHDPTAGSRKVRMEGRNKTAKVTDGQTLRIRDRENGIFIPVVVRISDAGEITLEFPMTVRRIVGNGPKINPIANRG